MEILLPILTFFIVGALGGFVSSSPLGPINLIVVDHKMNQKPKSLVPLLSGVILVDVIFGLCAAFGYQKLLSSFEYGMYFKIAGGILLIGMGILGIRDFWVQKSSVEMEEESRAAEKEIFGKERFAILKRYKKAQDFFVGGFLCGSNPGFLLWWVYLVQEVDKRLTLDLNLESAIAFGLGIAIGDAIWFSFLSFVSSRFNRNLQEKWTRLIRLSLAIGLVLFGIATFVV